MYETSIWFSKRSNYSFGDMTKRWKSRKGRFGLGLTLMLAPFPPFPTAEKGGNRAKKQI